MKKLEIKGKGEIKTIIKGEKHRIRFKYRDPNVEDPKDKGAWKYSPQRTVLGNMAKANRELEKYKEEFELAFNEIRSNTPFGEYARNWQDNRRKLQSISELALDRDEIEIERIEKYFPTTPISQLTPNEILKVILLLKEEGLSESALHKFWQKANQILKYAEKKDDISNNPCRKLDPIKRPEDKERKSLSTDQAIKLAKELKEEDPRTGRIVAVWLALALGLRRGEILGLRWCDIDLEKGLVYILNQYDVKHNLRTPKCSSQRVLSIDEGSIVFLSEWKEMVKIMFGFEEVPDDFPVCCTDNGDFIDPTAFDKWRRNFFVLHGLASFSKVEEWHDKRGIKRYRRSGYVGFNLHELRHTQATLLVGLGHDLKSIQEMLGHKSMQMTMAYTHGITQNRIDAAADFDRAILSAS